MLASTRANTVIVRSESPSIFNTFRRHRRQLLVKNSTLWLQTSASAFFLSLPSI
ncbi:hypothetical protein ARMSODRAFT_966766 [Armillaria solidipes]|uniref:Uncharacterized protein n=1 Tax=Armillaria solidipes TaxID=1076256 RepID=A0A2H3ALA6_9AGAR|nr:hypothetical protein ARMSODRAFT_966766 [Armillaria solidipes]